MKKTVSLSWMHRLSNTKPTKTFCLSSLFLFSLIVLSLPLIPMLCSLLSLNTIAQAELKPSLLYFHPKPLHNVHLLQDPLTALLPHNPVIYNNKMYGDLFYPTCNITHSVTNFFIYSNLNSFILFLQDESITLKHGELK